MMRRTRRDMLNKTMSEACLQATTTTNEVPSSPMKNRAAALKKVRWLSSRKLAKSLSFIVRKKSSSTTTTRKKCCGGHVAVDKTETGSCTGSATASSSNRSTSDESERPVAGIVQTDIERIVANSCSPGPKGDEVILHQTSCSANQPSASDKVADKPQSSRKKPSVENSPNSSGIGSVLQDEDADSCASRSPMKRRDPRLPTQPRRSLSHRDFGYNTYLTSSNPVRRVTPKRSASLEHGIQVMAASATGPPKASRRSSLDLSDHSIARMRAARFNPPTLYSPIKSLSPQKRSTARSLYENASPSTRNVVEAADFSETGSVALSVYDSSICVSQALPTPMSSPSKPRGLLTPKRSIRSLFGGNGKGEIKDIALTPSLLLEAIDFSQSNSGHGCHSRAGSCPSTPTMAIGFSTCCPQTPASSKELMALAIAEGIRKALKIQRQNEKELHERYFNHISFAKGRDSNGNETGAILCMRKAKRVERELGRVNEAISCLERHLADIDEYTSKRALHSEIAPLPFLGDIEGRGRVEHSHAGGRGAAPPTPTLKASFDLSVHKNYAHEVEQILTVTDERKDCFFQNSTALLEELRALNL